MPSELRPADLKVEGLDGLTTRELRILCWQNSLPGEGERDVLIGELTGLIESVQRCPSCQAVAVILEEHGFTSRCRCPSCGLRFVIRLDGFAGFRRGVLKALNDECRHTASGARSDSLMKALEAALPDVEEALRSLREEGFIDMTGTGYVVRAVGASGKRSPAGKRKREGQPA